MADDDLGEKSEDPTPKRRQDSREDGQVAKSQDLSGAVLLGVATMAVAASSLWMFGEAKIVMSEVLDGSATSNLVDPEAAGDVLQYLAVSALRISAPVLLILWAAGFIGQVSQIGWLFAPKAVQPKLSKLNPISGFKRIFGLNALVKASLDSVKVLIVVIISVSTARQYSDQILVLPYLSMMQCMATIGSLMLNLALRILAILLLLGIIDFTYQRWKMTRDLRMTKQQVKDEMKQTEGDPEVKRRRARIQQQIAMQRISSAVPQADVIVTNPEHIAIAIKYDQDTMNAPTVIAKGADHLAARIRQLAMKHGIPVVERKPLARALYKHVGVGQEIPPDYYSAVAEVLAYVYRLGGKMAG